MMKTKEGRKIRTIILPLFLVLLFITSCSKNDNPLSGKLSINFSSQSNQNITEIDIYAIENTYKPVYTTTYNAKSNAYKFSIRLNAGNYIVKPLTNSSEVLSAVGTQIHENKNTTVTYDEHGNGKVVSVE